ncbi:hypothetical protein K458DRAFT_385694 [Lentithecium fluviatile CBS 122367]|uniref:Uncharacterized protein n=1 Tax=Lentithecium fluviatile CBS 122367 TaxID=1168545 RepID=A0A6G1JC31_9PLEO|nr:hypothetical protein K458DRAFT_385694 [Lentithecium fluviatile CBS 122367]
MTSTNEIRPSTPPFEQASMPLPGTQASKLPAAYLTSSKGEGKQKSQGTRDREDHALLPDDAGIGTTTAKQKDPSKWDSGSDFSDLLSDETLDHEALEVELLHSAAAGMPTPPPTSAATSPPAKGKGSVNAGLSTGILAPVFPVFVTAPVTSPAQKGTSKAIGQNIFLHKPLSMETLTSKRGIPCMEKFLTGLGIDTTQGRFRVRQRAGALATKIIALQEAEKEQLGVELARKDRLPSQSPACRKRSWDTNEAADRSKTNPEKKHKQYSRSPQKAQPDEESMIPEQQLTVKGKKDVASQAHMTLSPSPSSSSTAREESSDVTSESSAEEPSEEEDSQAPATPPCSINPPPDVSWPGVFLSSSAIHHSQAFRAAEKDLKLLAHHAQRKIEHNSGLIFNFSPNAHPNVEKQCIPGAITQTAAEKELASYKINAGYLAHESGDLVMTAEIQVSVLRIMRGVRDMLECCAYGPHPTYEVRFVRRDEETQRDFYQLREKYDEMRCALAAQVELGVEWEDGVDGEGAARRVQDQRWGSPWKNALKKHYTVAFAGILLTHLPNLEDLDIRVEDDPRFGRLHGDPLLLFFSTWYDRHWETNRPPSSVLLEQLQGLKEVRCFNIPGPNFPSSNCLFGDSKRWWLMQGGYLPDLIGMLRYYGPKSFAISIDFTGFVFPGQCNRVFDKIPQIFRCVKKILEKLKIDITARKLPGMVPALLKESTTFTGTTTHYRYARFGDLTS